MWISRCRANRCDLLTSTDRYWEKQTVSQCRIGLFGKTTTQKGTEELWLTVFFRLFFPTI